MPAKQRAVIAEYAAVLWDIHFNCFLVGQEKTNSKFSVWLKHLLSVTSSADLFAASSLSRYVTMNAASLAAIHSAFAFWSEFLLNSKMTVKKIKQDRQSFLKDCFGSQGFPPHSHVASYVPPTMGTEQEEKKSYSDTEMSELKLEERLYFESGYLNPFELVIDEKLEVKSSSFPSSTSTPSSCSSSSSFFSVLLSHPSLQQKGQGPGCI
jgi:hypothetical protein